MNVLMGINAPWVGGTRIHVLHLAQALEARGHRVILVTDGEVLEEEMERRGIRFIRRAHGLEAMLDLLLELAERERIDIIHAHPAAFIWEGCLISRLTGLPLVVTMHGEYVMQFRRSPLGVKLAETARTVIAVSDEIRQYLLREASLSPAQVRVIPNGINVAEFRPGLNAPGLRGSLGVPSGTQVVAYVGRLESDKRASVTAAAEAVCRLAAAGAPVCGLFVGQGDLLEGLEEQGRRMEAALGRRVLCLPGFRTDLPYLLNLADVVVAAGRSALEAMATSRPVIAAGRAGYAGPVTPDRWLELRASNFGDHGTLPEATADTLTADLSRLLRDRRRRRWLGEALRCLVVADYDLGRVAAEVEAVYAEALAGR